MIWWLITLPWNFEGAHQCSVDMFLENLIQSSKGWLMEAVASMFLMPLPFEVIVSVLDCSKVCWSWQSLTSTNLHTISQVSPSPFPPCSFPTTSNAQYNLKIWHRHEIWTLLKSKWGGLKCTWSRSFGASILICWFGTCMAIIFIRILYFSVVWRLLGSFLYLRSSAEVCFRLKTEDLSCSSGRKPVMLLWPSASAGDLSRRAQIYRGCTKHVWFLDVSPKQLKHKVWVVIHNMFCWLAQVFSLSANYLTPAIKIQIV